MAPNEVVQTIAYIVRVIEERFERGAPDRSAGLRQVDVPRERFDFNRRAAVAAAWHRSAVRDVEKVGTNSQTQESTVAVRRRVIRNDALPLNDEYGKFLGQVLADAGQWVGQDSPLTGDPAPATDANKASTQGLGPLSCNAGEAEDEMSVRQIVGLVLTIAGVVALLWGGFFWTDRDTVLDAGPLTVQTNERKGFPVPTVVSGIVLAAGVLLLVVPSRRRV